MATRSSFLFSELNDGDIKKVCNVYIHYDGYPKGNALKFCEWVKDYKMVNGLSVNSDFEINGVGCLAAQFTKKFKEKAGGVYITSPSDWGNLGETYLYDVIVTDEEKIEFVAYSDEQELFRGSPEEFLEKFK
jgi:hypothetical protein